MAAIQRSEPGRGLLGSVWDSGRAWSRTKRPPRGVGRGASPPATSQQSTAYKLLYVLWLGVKFCPRKMFFCQVGI